MEFRVFENGICIFLKRKISGPRLAGGEKSGQQVLLRDVFVFRLISHKRHGECGLNDKNVINYRLRHSRKTSVISVNEKRLQSNYRYLLPGN